MHIPLLSLLLVVGCANEAPAPPTLAPAPAAVAAKPAAPAAPAKPKPADKKTVLDIALESPDHTTLVTAVKAADLAGALGSPGGIYTVFAPTNAAFDKLPPGTVEGLLKPEKKADLRKIIQHHASVPIVNVQDMKDGQTMSMSDGTAVTLHVKDGKVMVENATILGSVNTVNGVVHVVDTVILPPG